MGTREVRHLVLALLLALTAMPLAQSPTPLTAGMIITESVTIRPGTYRLASKDLETPAIRIRGENITVDFNGAVLEGAPRENDPDTFTGLGILIDGGSGITVKNAVVRGYKVGILARQSPRLHLTRNDVSYNWKQRLYSQIEKESLVDWMSYHNNEKGEWLRFGAGIYVDGCEDAEIDHNTAVQGQNGLMVTHSPRAKIWNNTFQFLSSLGIGLYRVSHSRIMHNKIDWCVRGYSHGYYNRGQDSAGLLMYEQSSNNVVAYNSITHGGDGLFLWAGQSTMDTGKGGANDNLFYRNDFSHAPTNGIETTFSRNSFVENRIDDCWHGVWGGYSWDSAWIGNRFARNAEAIAIEHGQNNRIEGNVFERDLVGIRLWQNATQDPNWGYPKNRDTRSRGYRIFWNQFENVETPFDIRDTEDVDYEGSGVGSRITPAREDPLPGGMDAMLPKDARRGRETIIVDEWGPYDWKHPKLWPVLEGGDAPLPYRRRVTSNGAFDGPIKLNVLGPAGTWTLVSARGATVSSARGKVGDVITVTPSSKGVVDYEVTLSYVGEAVTSPRGAVTPAGKPYLFTYSRFFAPVPWRIDFYPGKSFEGTPIASVSSNRIDYLSGRDPFAPQVPADNFTVSAEGKTTLPPGEYTLEVISDDGVRVWIDGHLAIDEWEPHESKVSRVPLKGGAHEFKVQYYEVGGFAELRFDIQKGARK